MLDASFPESISEFLAHILTTVVGDQFYRESKMGESLKTAEKNFSTGNITQRMDHPVEAVVVDNDVVVFSSELEDIASNHLKWKSRSVGDHHGLFRLGTHMLVAGLTSCDKILDVVVHHRPVHEVPRLVFHLLDSAVGRMKKL